MNDSYFLAPVLGMDAWFGFILLWRSSFNLRKLVVSDYITLVLFFFFLSTSGLDRWPPTASRTSCFLNLAAHPTAR